MAVTSTSNGDDLISVRLATVLSSVRGRFLNVLSFPYITVAKHHYGVCVGATQSKSHQASVDFKDRGR